jgi:dolichyl-phosphate beta-glucosyltransferase
LAIPLLTLLIPAFNEADRLGDTLSQVLTYLGKQAYASEVLVVDDGSVDSTVAVAEKHFAAHSDQIHVATRVLSYSPNRGKGYAVRQGLLAATGEIAVFSDADLSTPIEELPKLLDPLVAGKYDVVFGSRSLNRSLIGHRQPWMREQSGRMFNLVVRATTGMPYTDTQCGFKAFRLAVCRPIAAGAKLDRFGFDVELLFLAYQAGLRLHEQPVRWNDATGSKVSVFAGLHGFKELWSLRRWSQQGLYREAIALAQAAATTASPSSI